MNTTRLTITFNPGTPDSLIRFITAGLEGHPDVASFDCSTKQIPDPDGWTPHTTGECPCDPDQVVQTILSWESYPDRWDPDDRPASTWAWDREGGITHWRLAQP